jgi:predicted branched-subunit amino acid permease
MENKKSAFFMGFRRGIPISLGYFAVSFALGITAKNSGLNVLQATLSSLLVNASAGEYAGFQVIAESAGYAEMAIMMLVVNARYLLMSCALSQKLPTQTPLIYRMLVAFHLTDENFGLSIAYPGKLNPFFSFGIAVASIPGWALGTCLGVVMGNILPGSIVSALSVGLYGMFLAIIIPPARTNRVLAGVVGISMLLSFVISRIKWFENISSGTQIIILTVVIAGAAALLFPVKEDHDAE